MADNRIKKLLGRLGRKADTIHYKRDCEGYLEPEANEGQERLHISHEILTQVSDLYTSVFQESPNEKNRKSFLIWNEIEAIKEEDGIIYGILRDKVPFVAYGNTLFIRNPKDNSIKQCNMGDLDVTGKSLNEMIEIEKKVLTELGEEIEKAPALDSITEIFELESGINPYEKISTREIIDEEFDFCNTEEKVLGFIPEKENLRSPRNIEELDQN